jgi:Co/Zn/Cd efflux system component
MSVILSAGAVALTGSAWPDLLVSAGIVTLFLSSASGVIRGSLAGIASARQRDVVPRRA